GVPHEDIGVETRSAAYLQRQVADRDPTRAYRLYQDRLRQCRDDDIVEIEIGILGLRLCPRRKRSENIVAKQHHQVVALGKAHQPWRRSEPSYYVQNSVCVTIK